MNTNIRPTSENKNLIFQTIARQAIARKDYKFGIFSARKGQEINCLCSRSIILEGICYHMMGKYDKSTALFRKGLGYASDVTSKNEAINIMKEYDIPIHDDYLGCVYELYTSIRAKRIIKASCIAIMLVLLFIMAKFILF